MDWTNTITLRSLHSPKTLRHTPNSILYAAHPPSPLLLLPMRTTPLSMLVSKLFLSCPFVYIPTPISENSSDLVTDLFSASASTSGPNNKAHNFLRYFLRKDAKSYCSTHCANSVLGLLNSLYTEVPLLFFDSSSCCFIDSRKTLCRNRFDW